jgi:hypothetical protein
MIRWLAAAVVAAALLVGGWFGYRALVRPASASVTRVAQVVPEGAPDNIETIATGSDAAVEGATPMAQRVAVLGLLNKRNGEARELTLKPGGAVRVGDVAVRLSACEKTAPWEPEQLTGGFVQVDVREADRHWRRAFSGWLFRERPALNVVMHPVYDVWVKSCTMSFPTTVPAASPTPAARRSSAARSAVPADTPAAVPSSAVDSNAI